MLRQMTRLLLQSRCPQQREEPFVRLCCLPLARVHAPAGTAATGTRGVPQNRHIPQSLGQPIANVAERYLARRAQGLGPSEQGEAVGTLEVPALALANGSGDAAQVRKARAALQALVRVRLRLPSYCCLNSLLLHRTRIVNIVP